MPPDEEPDQGTPKASLWLIMAAVFWSFFGVRKQADHERIAASVRPQHYIFAGLLGAVLFVVMLLVVVKLVLHFVHPA